MFIRQLNIVSIDTYNLNTSKTTFKTQVKQRLKHVNQGLIDLPVPKFKWRLGTSF